MLCLPVGGAASLVLGGIYGLVCWGHVAGFWLSFGAAGACVEIKFWANLTHWLISTQAGANAARAAAAHL